MPLTFLNTLAVSIDTDYLFGDKGVDQIAEFKTIGGFISAILPNVFIVAGLILFFFLLFGGFIFMLNSGEDNPEGMAAGKKAITAAIAGFALIFFAYWLMQIIQVITGINFFKPPNL